MIFLTANQGMGILGVGAKLRGATQPQTFFYRGGGHPTPFIGGAPNPKFIRGGAPNPRIFFIVGGEGIVDQLTECGHCVDPW